MVFEMNGLERKLNQSGTDAKGGSRTSIPPMEQRGTRKTNAAGAETTVGFCEGEKVVGTAEMISERANLAFDSLPGGRIKNGG